MTNNLSISAKLVATAALIFTLMIIIASILSCNPSARLARKQAVSLNVVLADPSAMNTVGVIWSQDHKCANDTTIFNFGRDTVTSYLHDTLLDGYTYHDTVYKTVDINTVKTVRIHDTLNRYIVDSRAVNSLTDSLNHYRQLQAASDGQILQISNVSATYQNSANHWKWLAWITWILLVIGFVIGVIIKLKKV